MPWILHYSNEPVVQRKVESVKKAAEINLQRSMSFCCNLQSIVSVEMYVLGDSKFYDAFS